MPKETDMVSATESRRPGLAARWPTALGIVCALGAIGVIVLLDRDVEFFVPVVATMAGIYLMAYALGRPRTAWLAFFVLSVVVGVLQVLDYERLLPVDPAVAMTIVVVVLWLWAVIRRRFVDGATFTVQTAGMAGFGEVTLVCAVLAPRWALALAGAAFLAHAAWDAYHFRVNKVVNRPYAEFCGVLDILVGPALIIAAIV
jgi:hypothetical protein